MSLQARFALNYPGFALQVDLALPASGISVLFGPSGCGKTTLLRCMAGLHRASGHFSVNGDIWQDAQRFVPVHQRALGYVFQDANLFAHLNVRANLQFGLLRTPPAQRRVSLERALQLLDIGHLLERMPQGLSGGERQRVAIARALLCSPRLLLLDEPLAALDQARKNEFLPYLERLHSELDIPVVYVSHAADEVARLADHLVLMDAGKVVASGALTETLARLDLALPLGEDSGVVLLGQIVERDTEWQLARVGFSDGSLWVRDAGHAVGAAVRVRILARDVSISLGPVSGTSIQNCLPAQIIQLADDQHPAQTLARLQIGAAPLLARLTRRSAHRLGLAPGLAVWVQIKAVALIG